MIYYSHINEDSRIERKLLAESGYSTVVAICGSGERVISLLDAPLCKKFVIVDFNSEAILLFQLKIIALTELSVDEYLGFVGHFTMEANERMRIFDVIKKGLANEALLFWEGKRNLVKNGILYAGHFERFLGRIRPGMNMFLGRAFQEKILNKETRNHFPHKRWSLLRKLFSYKLVYKLAGNKDIAFIGESSRLNLIPAAIDKKIHSNTAHHSFMSHLIFKGDLLDMELPDLPPSLNKEVLAVIQKRLRNKEIIIEYHSSDLLHFVNNNNQERSCFYSISDILSFVDQDYLKRFFFKVGDESLVTVRSFLRNRLSVDDHKALNKYGTVLIHDEEESSGMYQVFSVKFKNKPL